MKSKVVSEFLVGSALFVCLLSGEIPAAAQSPGDASSPQAQQPAVGTETKPAVTVEARKVVQTKSFTLEGGKVWVDTGISLEPGQRIAVT